MLAERVAACSASATDALGAAAAAEHERRGAAMHLDEVLAHARAELQATTSTV